MHDVTGPVIPGPGGEDPPVTREIGEITADEEDVPAVGPCRGDQPSLKLTGPVRTSPDPRPPTMQPDLRATIRRDGVVRAVRWAPYLEVCGPAATLLESRDRAGVTIADLAFLKDETDVDTDDPDFDEPEFWEPSEDETISEVLVTFLCGGDEHAKQAIVDWAALVGLSRVWFPDDVRDVAPAEQGKVEVRCTGCCGRLVDGFPRFWEFVRRNRFFPMSCPLCGADVPQWHPSARKHARRPGRPQLVEAAPDEAGDMRVSDHRTRGRR